MKTGPSHNYPCPHCGAHMNIHDTRETMHMGAYAIRRRRRCLRCAYNITTMETQWRRPPKSAAAVRVLLRTTNSPTRGATPSGEPPRITGQSAHTQGV